MAGLLERTSLTIESYLHSGLDVLQSYNSPAVAETQARRFEQDLRKVEDLAAETTGETRTLRREVKVLEDRATTLQRTIVHILNDGIDENDGEAIKKDVELNGPNGVNVQLQAKRETLASTEKTAEDLATVVTNLQAQHQNALNEIDRLKNLSRNARAKETALSAVQKANSIAGRGSAASVDNMMRKEQHRSDVADVKLEGAMNEFNATTGKDAVLADSKLRIEALKRELAAKKVS